MCVEASGGLSRQASCSFDTYLNPHSHALSHYDPYRQCSNPLRRPPLHTLSAPCLPRHVPLPPHPQSSPRKPAVPPQRPAPPPPHPRSTPPAAAASGLAPSPAADWRLPVPLPAVQPSLPIAISWEATYPGTAVGSDDAGARPHAALQLDAVVMLTKTPRSGGHLRHRLLVFRRCCRCPRCRNRHRHSTTAKVRPPHAHKPVVRTTPCPCKACRTT